MREVVSKQYTLGIVGVRGYVGRELLRLLADHSNIKVDWVSSRQLAGSTLSNLVESDDNFQFRGVSSDHYYQQVQVENLAAVDVANRNTDIVVLALPNGLAKPFVELLENSDSCKVIIDLSADYRFDNDWFYSVPELSKLKFIEYIDKSEYINKSEHIDKNEHIDKSKLIKISNPGCYATAMQIGLAPLVEQINGIAHCFGVSGYSGAGTKPSVNNDPLKLKNNILPYGLIEHLHEKEVAYQLKTPISFSPHVAEFFRGISMTIQLELNDCWQQKDIAKLFTEFYQNQPNIKVIESIPNIQQVVNTNDCIVGGFTLSENGRRLSLVSCLDNLLKGAASQALENINLALNIK